MNLQEFSNQFDILYNNISSNMAPGLDEYDKSVFLTRAQEALVMEYYSGDGKDGVSFEDTEEARRYLTSLVKTLQLTIPATATVPPIQPLTHNSKFYEIPDYVWYTIYEEVILADSERNSLPYSDMTVADIVPISHDAFRRIKKNPFRTDNSGRVLKLSVSNVDKVLVELISRYDIQSYTLRYIQQPTPIILDAIVGSSINGIMVATPCALHPSLHQTILERAVGMALKIYNISSK